MVKKVLKERLEAKEFTNLEKLIEASEKEVKIKGMMDESGLSSKSQERFRQLLQNVDEEKNRLMGNLTKSTPEVRLKELGNGGNGVNVVSSVSDKVINKKLRELLKELKVEINVSANIGLL